MEVKKKETRGSWRTHGGLIFMEFLRERRPKRARDSRSFPPSALHRANGTTNNKWILSGTGKLVQFTRNSPRLSWYPPPPLPPRPGSRHFSLGYPNLAFSAVYVIHNSTISRNPVSLLSLRHSSIHAPRIKKYSEFYDTVSVEKY